MKSLIVLLLCPVVASAACVNGYPTVKKEYRISKFVLIGKVVADRKTTAGPKDDDFLDGDTYEIVPIRSFKGQTNSRLDVFSENSSGRFPMEMNGKYLLFLYEDQGRLIVDNCGNSDLISDAKKAAAEVAKLSGEP